MKYFKKTVVAVLIASMSISAAGCIKKQKEPPKKVNTEITTEYITEITKDNVDEIVGEYKNLLSYYNDLKNDLKTLNDVSKDGNLEKELTAAKESISSKEKLLTAAKFKYKPLYDAKMVLIKMYDVSSDMADVVTTDPNKYMEKTKEYDTLFTEFKTMMDTIRQDIEAVRGTEKKDEENTSENNSSSNMDVNKDSKNNDSNNTDSDSGNSGKNSGSKNNSSSDSNSNNANSNNNNNSNSSSSSNSSDKGSNSGSKNNSSSSNNSNSSNTSNNGSGSKNNGNETDPNIPKVSSLNNGVKSAIRNAGISSGARFKQNGGTPDQIEKVAIQTFNDIEGDNPIDKSQIAEARAIFVEAFKKAYYGN